MEDKFQESKIFTASKESVLEVILTLILGRS
jgi:hypothetical protein